MNAIKSIRKNVFQTTQTDFASIAGVWQSRVSDWENGASFPDLREMSRIRDTAADRGIPLDGNWFFDGPPTSAASAASAPGVSAANTDPLPAA